VWSYDAQAGKIWSAIAEETAVQTHFYSAAKADCTMDTRFEKFLSEVEGRAAPVYENILKGVIPKGGRARRDFAQFLALMHVRTPAMRRLAAEVLGRGIQIHSYAAAENEEAFDALTKRVEVEKGERIDPGLKEKIRKTMLNPSGYEMFVPQAHTLMALGASDKLAPIFYDMRWSIALATNNFLITSDNPLVRDVDPKSCHAIYGDHGFLNKTAEVTFPLSPRTLLLLSWKDDVHKIGALERDHVELVNKIRAANSDRYLYAHVRHKRIEDLAREFKDSRASRNDTGVRAGEVRADQCSAAVDQTADQVIE
jgi:hypothetical protein